MRRILISLMLMVGLVLTPVVKAAAQSAVDDQVFSSEVAGVDIDLGASGQIQFIPENYELNETRSFQEEYIWFTYNWSNFQLVFIAGPNETADYHDITIGNMETFYDGWSLIDEEISEDHSWFLGEAEFNDVLLLVYYEFQLDAFGDVDLVVMQFTDASTFLPDLELVRSEVTIDGELLLPNTDAQSLSQLMGQESDTAADEGNSSEQTGDVDEESGSTSRDRTSRTSRTTDPEDSGESDVGADGETTRDRTSRTSRTTDPDDTDGEDAEEEGETTRDRTSRTSRSGESEEGDVEVDEDTDEGATSRDRTSRTSRSTDSDDSEDSGSDTLSNPLIDIDTGNVSGRDTGEDSEDSTPVSGGDWGSMGLVSDTEWVSPSTGTTFTWDSAIWMFPEDYDQAIIIDVEAGYESVTLQTQEDGLGYVFVTVEENSGTTTPQSLIDWWTSPEYAEQFSNGITILESGSTANTAGIVYETTNALGEPLLVVLEATLMEDGTIIFSQVSAAPNQTAEVYGLYQSGVQVEGAPLDFTWTEEDISDISGN